MSLEVEKVRPYDSEEGKKVQIEKMFDNVAKNYDTINHLMTVGIDILWRKRAVREIGNIKPKQILDMATGTGDFAFEALKLNPEKIVGADLSQKMLDVGIQKAESKKVDIIDFVKADSENLSFNDNKFDAITVGFGVRNFENLTVGLKELNRVMKPEGMIAILEPSFPDNFLLKKLVEFNFKYITPLLGRLFSDGSAYTYLPSSVEAFPEGENFLNILSECGFKDNKHIKLSFGICALYIGRK